MATTSKKAAVRKSARDTKQKPRRIRVETASPEKVHILFEILIRQEGGMSVSNKMLALAEAAKFSYSFVTAGLTILSLSIEDKTVQDPGKSGTVDLASIPLTGEVLVNAVATGVGGSGTLQVTFQGKKLFETPAQFNVAGGTATINQKVKVPS